MSDYTILKTTEQDLMNLSQVEMLTYWNFVLVSDQNFYFRTKYKILDIIEEIGGLISVLFPIFAAMVAPCTFKTHKIKVFTEYQKYWLSFD